MSLIHALEKIQWNRSIPVVCAVSGGMDSMALLHALKMAEFNVVVAHINHQLRDDAFTDETFVRTMADTYGFPVRVKRAFIDPRTNIQNSGHQVRLAFYQEVAEEFETTFVFLAHHQDDQIEHFFIQVLRGFSKLSWHGMNAYSKVQGIRLIRPFLGIPKSEIDAYIKSHEIAYRHDNSNDSLKYLRNQIRHRIMPIIRQERPRFVARILKAQHRLKERIDAEISEYITSVDNRLIIKNPHYLDAPEAVQKRLLNHLWALTTERSPRSAKFWAMCHARLLQNSDNIRFEIDETYVLTRDYGHISIVSSDESLIQDTLIDAWGTWIISHKLKWDVTQQKRAHDSGLRLQLCYNERTFPITVRTAKKGDNLSFSYGHKKVSQWFKDQKIPWAQRRQIPILETGDGKIHIWHSDYAQSTAECEEKVYIYEVMNVEQ